MSISLIILSYLNHYHQDAQPVKLILHFELRKCSIFQMGQNILLNRKFVQYLVRQIWGDMGTQDRSQSLQDSLGRRSNHSNLRSISGHLSFFKVIDMSYDNNVQCTYSTSYVPSFPTSRISSSKVLLIKNQSSIKFKVAFSYHG